MSKINKIAAFTNQKFEQGLHGNCTKVSVLSNHSLKA
ncbi:MAG: hypothetical protein ACI87N_002755, partial [Flavobacteriales bacterium]